jgi:flagellar FliL protein
VENGFERFFPWYNSLIMPPSAREKAMADEDEEVEEEAPDEEDGEGASSGRGGKKKLVIILLLVTLLLVALIGGGLFMSGLLDPLLGVEEGEEGAETVIAKGQFYYKFEDMTVNLVSSGKKSRFFKLSLTVAVTQEADVSVMESLSPRVMDNVTQYLRELKPEEMAESANFHRVHNNVLLRVRTAVAPIIVTDALITMALVQ